ncbi:MAG: hypothetical protein R3F29_05970 [Planctomycetota bacterium]
MIPLLRSSLLSLLAFAAAGPSCFTAMLWAGGPIHRGASRDPGYHQRSEQSVPAFAEFDETLRLRLLLPAETMQQFGVLDQFDAGGVEFGPGDRATDTTWLVALLQAHLADPEAWPLKVMAIGRGGERRWYLVGGEVASANEIVRRDTELDRILDEQGVRLLPRFRAAPLGDDGVGLGSVRLARIDHVAGPNAWKELTGKVLLTPPALVVDTVLLPFEIIVVAFWLAS